MTEAVQIVRYDRTMIDELRPLAVFARITQSGSIRGAARSLGLSPSVVSHHLRGLEERLGKALIYRTTRRLALTPAGERLAKEAGAMVACAERGLDSLQDSSATLAGSLRVTLPSFLASTAFATDLAAFAQSAPKVELLLNFTESPRDLLRDGFDLALRFGPLADSSHRARRLCEMPRVLVGAPSLCATRKRARRPSDLLDWPFVHLASRQPILQLRHAASGRAAQVKYASRLAADNASAVRGLLLSGAGLATLPRVIVEEDLERGLAVEVLPNWHPPSVAVHAVWPEATVRVALTMHFLDFISPRIVSLFAHRRGGL